MPTFFMSIDVVLLRIGFGLIGTKIRYFFALPPMLLHRYSIVTPSLVHRFDGVTMDLWWSNDGVTSVFQWVMNLFSFIELTLFRKRLIFLVVLIPLISHYARITLSLWLPNFSKNWGEIVSIYFFIITK